MIVDANVILRTIDGGDGSQTRAARRRVAQTRETGPRLTLLSATVLELAFVLRSPDTGYGYPRDAIADVLDAVLAETAFDVEHREALVDAVAEYRERSIDLHDCLLHALAERRETKVLSFDRDLRRLGTGEAP